jgi:hypothetical protein
MMDQINGQLSASVTGESLRSMANGRRVAPTGENRLQATTGITTGDFAHAAVRMHVSPVFGDFWAYCPKTKTSHFQPRKVAI